MKKLLIFVLSCSLLLSCTACKEKPRDILTIQYEGNFSKESVSEFLDLLSSAEDQIAQAASEETYCYNITPDGMSSQSEDQLFTFTDNHALFLMRNEQIMLIQSIPFESMVEANPWDYDGDGNDDLLLSFHRDGAAKRGHVKIFNTATQTLVDVALTEKNVFALTAEQAAEVDPAPVTMGAVFEADVTCDHAAQSLTYQATYFCGKISVIGGTPVYIPSELPSFDYAEIQKLYPAGTFGVKTENFVNTAEAELDEPEEAVQRALNEVKIPYDHVEVAYDDEADVWRISVGTTDTDGGCQDVYMSNTGITLMTVAGE